MPCLSRSCRPGPRRRSSSAQRSAPRAATVAAADTIMLKFLTHKLRTHSLNEESVSEKVEERDSGTESDDEADRTDTGDFCTDVIMKWNDVTDINGESAGAGCACAPAASTARLLPPPEPDLLYDHHSSEEELEVINGARGAATPAPAARLESRRRAASSPPAAAPEKRKWSAQGDHPFLDPDDPAARAPSSDDDDTKVETPVRFRTSPPLEALKPRRAGGLGALGIAGSLRSASGLGGAGSLGSASGLDGAGSLGSASGASSAASCGCTRADSRRRRVALPPRRHRPALDFDKMQQLKVGGGPRSWRAVGGAHTGELSVFCW